VTHDANGAVTQYGTATLTWNARHELVQVVDGGTTTQFFYDCFGRRVGKSVNGSLTRYVYLGADLCAEADVNWAQTASYFYQPGVDRPVTRTDSAGTVWYLQDLAGSVTALARNDGTLYGRYHYSPWGEVVSTDPGMPAQPLRWTARELDNTGLYYLRSRYYLSSTGRLLSEDGIGLAGGLNLYVFALNSPVAARDPFGFNADWLDHATNFFSGMGSGVSFGLTDHIQDWMGTSEYVDGNSGAYFVGELIGDQINDRLTGGMGRLGDAADLGRDMGRMGGPVAGFMGGGGKDALVLGMSRHGGIDSAADAAEAAGYIPRAYGGDMSRMPSVMDGYEKIFFSFKGVDPRRLDEGVARLPDGRVDFGNSSMYTNAEYQRIIGTPDLHGKVEWIDVPDGFSPL
jgi:RHS repeat-associated protein